MTNEIEEKLAQSLTADTTELLPFMPYLLQDLWELGSKPGDIIKLMKNHVALSGNTRVLDVPCGKAAVSVRVAKELGVHIYGYDLLGEFIEYAKNKAEEWGVSSLCHFDTGDINELVETQKDYDLVIFGAAGAILGSPKDTLTKLSQTIKPGGFIIIAEGYLSDDFAEDDGRFSGGCATRSQWHSLLPEIHLSLVAELPGKYFDYTDETKAIAARADELALKYPDKKTMFEDYVKGQQGEVDFIHDDFIDVTWMLRKGDPYNGQ